MKKSPHHPLYVALALLGMGGAALLFAAPTTAPSENEKIEQLIRYVSELKGAVFIRNGTQHTAVEAAEHMRSKWQAGRARIHTAKEFIDLAASRSSLTGQAYRIRFPDGREITSEQLLKNELGRLETTSQPVK